MWKLHRYYLKEVGLSAALTFLVLFGIVLISLVYRGIDRAQGFGLLNALLITLFWAADTLPHLLPISLLFATVLTFARASQDREITAIRAAGISPRVAMMPALLLGVLFSVLASFAFHYAVPWAHFHKYRVVTDTLRTLMLETGMLGDKLALDEFVMTWDGKNEAGEWVGVCINAKRDTGIGVGVLLADEAWIEKSTDGDVISLAFRGLRKPAGKDEFFVDDPRIAVDLRRLTEDSRREEGDADMNSDQLLAEVYRGVHRRPNAARYIVHRRGCFALLPLLFGPLGFCIGVLSRQRGRVMALVFAMAPVFVFYLCDFIANRVIRVVDWPPIAWLPAVVLTVLGVPFCWRLLRV